jgi:putative SOS response-associated peptidase YedK
METVTEKPTFRDAFATRRCIIPASGWYEWSAPKTPWHVQLADGGVMGFAGLMLRSGGSNTRLDGDRFVVMTSAADGDLASIHHRQPLVLPEESWQTWLTGDAGAAQALCVARPADAFNWYRVAPAVGRVAEDHPGLVTPLDDAALAAEAATASDSNTPKSKDRSPDGQGDLFG